MMMIMVMVMMITDIIQKYLAIPTVLILFLNLCRSVSKNHKFKPTRLSVLFLCLVLILKHITMCILKSLPQNLETPPLLQFFTLTGPTSSYTRQCVLLYKPHRVTLGSVFCCTSHIELH
jgi:hypothetical protein